MSLYRKSLVNLKFETAKPLVMSGLLWCHGKLCDLLVTGELGVMSPTASKYLAFVHYSSKYFVVILCDDHFKNTSSNHERYPKISPREGIPTNPQRYLFASTSIDCTTNKRVFSYSETRQTLDFDRLRPMGPSASS